jgi:hypothetical protein
MLVGVRSLELMVGPPDHYVRVLHGSKPRYINYNTPWNSRICPVVFIACTERKEMFKNILKLNLMSSLQIKKCISAIIQRKRWLGYGLDNRGMGIRFVAWLQIFFSTVLIPALESIRRESGTLNPGNKTARGKKLAARLDVMPSLRMSHSKPGTAVL